MPQGFGVGRVREFRVQYATYGDEVRGQYTAGDEAHSAPSRGKAAVCRERYGVERELVVGKRQNRDARKAGRGPFTVEEVVRAEDERDPEGPGMKVEEVRAVYRRG